MDRVCQKAVVVVIGVLAFMQATGLRAEIDWGMAVGYPESNFGGVDRKPSEAPVSKKAFEKSEMRRKGVQEIAIIASDLGFFPKTVFVSRDVPVRLYVTGASKNTLCVMMDAFGLRKQVRSNRIEEITFTPEQPGKFRIYCPVNGMEGSLVVKELSTDNTREPAEAKTSE